MQVLRLCCTMCVAACPDLPWPAPTHLVCRGHVAAARALGGLQQEEMAALATADVVFKA